MVYELEIPGILIIPSLSAPLYASGKDYGLILDIGYRETRILPVMDGFPLFFALSSFPLGSLDCIQSFRHQILQKYINSPDYSQRERVLTIEKAEEILIQIGFISPSIEREKNSFPSLEIEIFTSNPTLQWLIPMEMRWNSMEILFSQSSQTREIHESIGGILLMSLSKVSSHLRPGLLQNLLITGGFSTFPGSFQRIYNEINHLMNENPWKKDFSHYFQRFRIGKTLGNSGNSAWIGGSLVGSMELQENEFINREELSFYTVGKKEEKKSWKERGINGGKEEKIRLESQLYAMTPIRQEKESNSGMGGKEMFQRTFPVPDWSVPWVERTIPSNSMKNSAGASNSHSHLTPITPASGSITARPISPLLSATSGGAGGKRFQYSTMRRNSIARQSPNPSGAALSSPPPASGGAGRLSPTPLSLGATSITPEKEKEKKINESTP